MRYPIIILVEEEEWRNGGRTRGGRGGWRDKWWIVVRTTVSSILYRVVVANYFSHFVLSNCSTGMNLTQTAEIAEDSSVSNNVKHRSQHAYPAAIYCGSGEDGVCVRERTKPSSCCVHISQAINAWCAGVLNRMGKHCGCLPVPITGQP